MKETSPYQIQHFIRILGVHAVVIPPLGSQMPLQFAYEKPKADHDHHQNPSAVLNYANKTEESVHQPFGI